jgi:hypothetical protein
MDEQNEGEREKGKKYSNERRARLSLEIDATSFFVILFLHGNV